MYANVLKLDIKIVFQFAVFVSTFRVGFQNIPRLGTILGIKRYDLRNLLLMDSRYEMQYETCRLLSREFRVLLFFVCLVLKLYVNKSTLSNEVLSMKRYAILKIPTSVHLLGTNFNTKDFDYYLLLLFQILPE